MTRLRVLSWNVAGRVARLAEQQAAGRAVDADVVCLQEVTPTTAPAWREALRDVGLANVRTSLDDWLPGEPPPAGRRLGVLSATCRPAEAFTVAHPPWAERLPSTVVEAPARFELHNVHSPISQKPGAVKLRTHRALAAAPGPPRGLPQLVVGDLNTPRRELPTGETWSFARDARGRIRPDRGEPWERGRSPARRS